MCVINRQNNILKYSMRDHFHYRAATGRRGRRLRHRPAARAEDGRVARSRKRTDANAKLDLVEEPARKGRRRIGGPWGGSCPNLERDVR